MSNYKDVKQALIIDGVTYVRQSVSEDVSNDVEEQIVSLAHAVGKLNKRMDAVEEGVAEIIDVTVDEEDVVREARLYRYSGGDPSPIEGRYLTEGKLYRVAYHECVITDEGTLWMIDENNRGCFETVSDLYDACEGDYVEYLGGDPDASFREDGPVVNKFYEVKSVGFGSINISLDGDRRSISITNTWTIRSDFGNSDCFELVSAYEAEGEGSIDE